MAIRRRYLDRKTQLTNRSAGDIAGDLLAEIGRKRGDCREDVFRFWFEIMGEKMGPLTEPVSIENGALTVKVKSSTLYSLLMQHEKARLLKKLNEKFAIRNLIFRVG